MLQKSRQGHHQVYFSKVSYIPHTKVTLQLKGTLLSLPVMQLFMSVVFFQAPFQIRNL